MSSKEQQPKPANAIRPAAPCAPPRIDAKLIADLQAQNAELLRHRDMLFEMVRAFNDGEPQVVVAKLIEFNMLYGDSK